MTVRYNTIVIFEEGENLVDASRKVSGALSAI
jgi:hypothetical protein